MQRTILIIIGWLAVVLGTIGVVLPLLPTTPFILLAAWCFARSSPRFHHWLLYRSWFGGYLRHWQRYKAMPPGAKPRAIIVILLTFGVSLWLVNMLWVRLLLLAILCGLLVFLWRIPVVEPHLWCCNSTNEPVNSGVFEHRRARLKVNQL